MKVQIQFGAMVPLLETQLGHQGLKMLSGPLHHVQKDADAIARLSARSVLSERETHNARRRLLKVILKHATAERTAKP